MRETIKGGALEKGGFLLAAPSCPEKRKVFFWSTPAKALKEKKGTTTRDDAGRPKKESE